MAMTSDNCRYMSQRLTRIVVLLLTMVGSMMQAQAAVPRWLHSLKVWVDSSDVSNCDTSYVTLPHEGFTVYCNNYLSGLRLHATMADLASNGMENPVSGFLGSRPTLMASINLSYRGWGLSYSRDLQHSRDTEMAYTFYGQRYGAEFRIHNTYSLTGDMKDEDQNTVYSLDNQSGRMRVLLANVYYVFDHNRFSHPAVTSHTTLQRRSAGSWLAMLNYFHSSYRLYEDDMPGHLKRMSMSQINVGGGYAYNYVFGQQHWVLHGSLTPMLAMWQRNRLYYEQGSKPLSNELSLSTVAHIHMVGNYGRFLTGMQSILNLDVFSGSEDYRSQSLNWTVRAFVGLRF